MNALMVSSPPVAGPPTVAPEATPSARPPHALSVDDAVRALDTHAADGLSAAQVESLRVRHHYRPVF